MLMSLPSFEIELCLIGLRSGQGTKLVNGEKPSQAVDSIDGTGKKGIKDAFNMLWPLLSASLNGGAVRDAATHAGLRRLA